MALNTSKLRWPEHRSDFKPNGMEIGMPSNGFFESSKRRTFSFSNCFSHVKPQTAENWLQAFAAWLNAPN
jgi:hypothetical protein